MTVHEFQTALDYIRALFEHTPEELRHTMRVLYAALDIASHEGGNRDLLIHACLLHDIGRSRSIAETGRHHAETGASAARRWLSENGYAEIYAEEVAACIRQHSRKGPAPETLEAKILYDADKLDLTGATGCLRLISGISGSEAAQVLPEAINLRFTTNYAARTADNKAATARAFLHALDNELTNADISGINTLQNVLTDDAFSDRLMLAGSHAAYQCDGYCLGGFSVIAAGGQYHLFAARWLARLGYPDGANIGSEIIHAISDCPEGPFSYRSTIVSSRQRGYWDSQSAADPSVIKLGDTYVMFYTGQATPDPHTRRIGYATTRQIDGKWVRYNHSIALQNLPENPMESPSVLSDGGFRTAPVSLSCSDGNRVILLESPRYDGTYKLICPDLTDGRPYFTPFLYRNAHGHFLLVSDGDQGRIFSSADGIYDWKPYEKAYDRGYIDDTLALRSPEERSHPFLLLNNAGRPTYLYTTVWEHGVSRILCQPINHTDGYAEDIGTVLPHQISLKLPKEKGDRHVRKSRS